MSEFAQDYEQKARLLAELRRAEVENAQLRQRAELAEAENARLEASRAAFARSSDEWRERARRAEADVGWWHATVANYVTSATAEDRALLRATLAEATTYSHPGAAWRADLAAARAIVDLARQSVRGGFVLQALREAIEEYDKEVREG